MEMSQLITKHNLYWKEKLDTYLTEALENCRGAMRYYKIQKQDPLITIAKPLLDPYF